MADRDLESRFLALAEPRAIRDRIIRQRNVALGLVLAFFVALFFAITVVKMRHMHMPQRPAAAGASAAQGAPRGP